MPAKRSTKIIATIGPATDSEEMLTKIIEAGVNIVRINMSHASREQVFEVTERVRKVAKECKRAVGVLMDLQGPAIRTGDVSSEIKLAIGDRIELTVRGEKSEEEYSVDVNYDGLVDDISVDDTVIVDNGEMHFKVLEKNHNRLLCEVLTPGNLGSRRHINLPGVRVNLPALTDKDRKCVEWAIEAKVDFIAMSFVRQAKDVTELREILKKTNSPQKIVAKLEDQEAIRNVDAIIDVADAIMVARGDLGVEVPFEELPIIQRRVVKHCQLLGKPVIVATHMLESMIENPSPTRAEITDVANAVFEQADAIMLSGETTIGKYPVQCVEIMDRIARRTERSGGVNYAREAEVKLAREKLTKSAVQLAEEMGAKAFVVFTASGRMARNAAWMRPTMPIFAFARNETVKPQLNILRGVRPFYRELDGNISDQVEHALDLLLERGLIEKGDWIVAISEVELRGKLVDTIQVEQAG